MASGAAVKVELPTETVLARARWIITFGGASAAFAYAAIMMIALPLSLNYIIAGDSSEPTKESQMIFTGCFFVKQLSSFLFAAALGEAGSVIGRKKSTLLALIGYSSAAVLSLLGHVAGIVAFHVLAQISLGATSPFMPTALAYLTDVSTTKQLARNVGIYQGVQFAGLEVGFVVALATIATLKTSEAVTCQYVFAAVSMFFASVLFCWKLPDISPARDSRRSFQFRSAVPYQPFLGMWSRPAYTRLVFLQHFLQMAGNAAGQAYLTNYAFKRFGMTVLGMVSLSLFSLTWASICAVAVYRCFRLKTAVGIGYAAAILSALSVMIAPSNQPSVIVIASFLSGPAAGLSGGLQALFYGQVPEKERGELAGALKACGSLGQMIGGPIGGVFATIWMGSSEIQAAFPGFPCVSNAVFFALSILVFVINETRYQTQDMLAPTQETPGQKKALDDPQEPAGNPAVLGGGPIGADKGETNL